MRALATTCLLGCRTMSSTSFRSRFSSSTSSCSDSTCAHVRTNHVKHSGEAGVSKLSPFE